MREKLEPEKRCVMPYAPEMMVKQRLGDIPATDKHGRFEVFTTGRPGWYLFCPMQAPGISGTIQFPVKGSDLKPGCASLLVSSRL